MRVCFKNGFLDTTAHFSLNRNDKNIGNVVSNENKSKEG